MRNFIRYLLISRSGAALVIRSLARFGVAESGGAGSEFRAADSQSDPAVAVLCLPGSAARYRLRSQCPRPARRQSPRPHPERPPRRRLSHLCRHPALHHPTSLSPESITAVPSIPPAQTLRVAPSLLPPSRLDSAFSKN